MTGFGDDKPITRLRIVVTDLDGDPIDRASVIVRLLDGEKVKRSLYLKTNQRGEVKLPPLPIDEVLVQVIAKNYQTFGKKYKLEGGRQKIEIRLNPPQPQYSVHR